MKNPTPYVLITPARNEAPRIGHVLRSVIAQQRRPLRWIIIDDGSTDGTDRVVWHHARGHDWIELLSARGAGRPDFGSKARAVAAGVERVAGLPYRYIGNLDADVSFEADYFARLLERMEADPRLGLAGGVILEPSRGRLREQRIAPGSVAGAVQMFRRECFEAIGGYPALDRGGIDSAAEIMVRMRGWNVATIRELKVVHHGPVTTGRGGVLRARFNKGLINRRLGYHPLFQLASGLYRMSQPPLVLGGLLMIAGYIWAAARGVRPALDTETVAFLRAEQLARLGRG